MVLRSLLDYSKFKYVYWKDDMEMVGDTSLGSKKDLQERNEKERERAGPDGSFVELSHLSICNLLSSKKIL
jgi:hypothetical protein